MPRYRLLDYYLRSVVTAVLSLGIVSVAAWQELHGGNGIGPFRDWAGLIVGVYFGSHVAFNGGGARQRSGDTTPPTE